MNSRLLTLVAAFTMAGGMGTAVMAEDLNLNEKPDTVRVSLAPYNLGLGGGVISALNDELMDESPAFLKLSLVQSIFFADRWDMEMDMSWLLPGQNWSGDMSVNFLFATGSFKPFIGVGGGVAYFDKRGSDFGHDLGASGSVQVGMILDILDELQLRIRVPIQVVANDARDRTVGMEGAFLFSSPLRNTKVKKLKY